MYRLARAQRREDLVDQPEVPLFFGRLDYEHRHRHTRPGDGADADRVYVGRRHVRDDAARRWSSTGGRRSRCRSTGPPRRTRRAYGCAAATGSPTPRSSPRTRTSRSPANRRLDRAAAHRRDRAAPSGPMRDIVATIQPDQDELVRAPLQPSICVQGAPGTGKTAVGLHRLAYLLYTDGPGSAPGVTVVGPNRSFLAYIRHVLPALGEVSVLQKTIDEVLERPVTGADTARGRPGSRAMPGWPRCCTGHSGATSPSRRRPGVRARLDPLPGRPGRVAECVSGLRASARYGPGRDAVAQRLAHLVLTQMERRGATPDDRELGQVARSAPVRALLDAVWPKLTPEQVLFRLLSDPAWLAEVAQACSPRTSRRSCAGPSRTGRRSRLAGRPPTPCCWTSSPG